MIQELKKIVSTVLINVGLCAGAGMSVLPAEELLSDLSERKVHEKPDRVQELLGDNGTDKYTMRTLIGLIIQGKKIEVNNTNVGHILKFSADKENFSKTAGLLAMSDKRLEWCKALAGARGGEELAAAAQAAAGLMTFFNAQKIERTGKKVERVPSVDANFVDALLGAKSTITKEMAATAVVYGNINNLMGKVAALEEKNGALPGLILLAKVKTGKAITAEDIELALKAKKQPKAMRTISRQALWDQLYVPVQVPVATAIGESGNKSLAPQLIEIFEEKDMRSQIAAARAMAVLGAEEVLPALHKRMAKIKKHEWPLILEICNTLGAIPHVDSIQVLIDFLSDETGRMRQDSIYALSSIRGEKNYLGTGKDWQAWWDGAQAEFKVDLAKTKLYRETVKIGDVFVPSLGNFYGLNILSDRICFVVDTSKSMQGDKIDNLRTQSEMTVDGLDDVVRFNLVDFGGTIKIYYPGGLTSDKAGLNKYIQEMPLSFATRSYDAMQPGMELDEVDSIYFLSDGAPIQTEIQDWPGIMNMLNFQHRFRPLAFYTVSFSAGKANAKHMQRLSDLNVGKSKEIE